MSEDLSSYLHVMPGDLVFNRLSTWQGAFGVSEYEGIVSPAYVVLRPNEHEQDSRFLSYLLHSSPYMAELKRLSKWQPPAQFDILWEDLRGVSIPEVPHHEQRRIADFLDDRVTRIDKITTARRRQAVLIELARMERLRQLTEGSGASQGWSRPRVAHVFLTGSGSTPPSDRLSYYDGGVPWVNTGDVRDGPLTCTARTVSESALADFSTLVLYPAGSLVIAMYGQGATKGRTALLERAACVNQACCVLQGDAQLLRWAFHWFRAHKREIVELANGAGQPNLSQETIRNVRLAIPKREFTEPLLQEIEEHEATVAKAQQRLNVQTDLLQEYKQSLITAAVTGELDVTTAESGIPG